MYNIMHALVAFYMLSELSETTAEYFVKKYFILKTVKKKQVFKKRWAFCTTIIFPCKPVRGRNSQVKLK